MMTLLQLAGEFFLIGLFSFGGGLATVPFLMSLSERTAWFSLQELSNMIALSQTTPGPIGINLSAYVGYTVAGIPGSILAVFCLTLPPFIILLFLAHLIGKLRGNTFFEGIFFGLRPASVGLIAAVLLSLCISTFFTFQDSLLIHWKAIAVFLLITACSLIPKLRRLPIPVFLVLSALVGICLRM